jgi:hypothetical protein
MFEKYPTSYHFLWNLKLQYGGPAKILVRFPFGGYNGSNVISRHVELSIETMSMRTRVTQNIVYKTTITCRLIR